MKIEQQEKLKMQQLEKIFSEFSKPKSISWQLGRGTQFTKVSISDLVPEAYLLKHILADTLGFPCDYMPMEKVLWEIGFVFDGILCKVASQKFGHRLYIESDDDKEISETTNALVKKFNASVKIASAQFQRYAEIEMKKGNLTVGNQYSGMLSMYQYLRDQSIRKRNEKTKIPRGAKGIIAPAWNAEVDKLRQAAYLEESAYFAFFGLLEHLLVLFLAFNDFDPKTDDLKKFIFEPWSEKFKRAFDLRIDKDAARFYDFFTAISRKHRNPRAHGMFNKDGRNMGFYLEGVGILSADFSREKSDETFPWMHMNGSALLEMDRFLAWLKQHPFYKIPMQIIEGGLEIDFTKKSRERYENLIRQGDATDFIEHESYLLDQYANMDW